MRLAVVGTGLMGSSFALAARQQGLFERIVGIDPDPDHRARALARGVVDEFVEAVPAADAVLLAGPGHTIAPWVVRLARSPWWERSPDRDLPPNPPILFDLASVKAPLLDEIRAALGALPARFVPCHPLAGSEQSGPAAADAGMFRDAEVILTPTEETDAAALDAVTGWWRAVGARTRTLDAGTHDAVLARTSHLPHLLAFAYLQRVEAGDLPFTAGGFRDFTRIGTADGALWASVFRLNRCELLAALEGFQGELERLRGLIEAGDEAALLEYLRAAARRRGGA